MSPPIPRNSRTTADGIGRQSGLFALATTLVLQSGLILWAGYIDIDRTPPEEAPIRTAIRFVVATAGPQAEAETPPLPATPLESLPLPVEPPAEPVPETERPVEPVEETPPPMPDPPEAVAEPPPEKAPEPVVEKVLPEPVEPKPVVKKPRKRIAKKVVEKPRPAPKPDPPVDPEPEPVLESPPDVPNVAAEEKAATPPRAAERALASSTEPAESTPPPPGNPVPELTAPISPTAVSESKTADALLAALASMIERHKKYPRAAQRARLEGEVRVKVLVDGAGTVKHFNLVDGSGHRILDKATLDIFKRIAGRRIAANDLRRALEILVPVRYVQE